MANTEILGTLKQVRNAENVVSDAMDNQGVTADQYQILQDSLDKLRELDDTLVLQDINDSLDQLNTDSQALQGLIKQMNQASASLQAVSTAVEKAANAISALVDIMTKAAGAGLV